MRANLAGEPVVVGVDGSEAARDAVRWAAREAHRRKLPLRLVSAFSWPDRQPTGEALLSQDFREKLLGAVRDQLSAAAETASEVVSGLRIEQQVVSGFPAAVLRAESEHARMLVLGGRGLGGVVGLLVGSVTIALASHASCPVIVVKGPDPAEVAPDRPVVVGVDGSPHSEAAIAFAYEAAAVRGAPLLAVHTWSDRLLDPSLAPVVDWEAIGTDERELLAERLAGWAEKYPEVKVRRLVIRSQPAHALVEQSADAQLVVVGSRGRGALAGLVLGSVSHALLHRAECPVAVVQADRESERDVHAW